MEDSKNWKPVVWWEFIGREMWKDNWEKGITDDQIKSEKEETKITKTETGTITIAMPYIIQENHLHQLTQKIQKENESSIHVEFKQFNSFKEFKETLSKDYGEENNIDIALVPSMRIRSFSEKAVSLPFKNDILSLFHSSLRSLILDTKMKYIPFALDPLVSIHPWWRDVSFVEKIDRLLYTNPSDKNYFWISSIDIRFLEEKQHPLSPYEETLELLVGSILQEKNHTLLQRLAKWEKRSFRSLYKESRTITDTCIDNSLACLYLLDAWWFWILPLSRHLLSIDQLTDQLLPNKEYEISSVPELESLHWNSWGFMVFEESENKQSSIERLAWYIQYAEVSNTPLREYSLSAFNSILSKQLSNEKFKNIRSFVDWNKINISKWQLNQLEERNNESPLFEALINEYSSKLYIDTFWK